MRSERERAQPRKKLARLSKGHSRGGDAGTISGRTKLCFILGWPVDHSCSPAMQNAAFRALELPWIFLPWAVRPDHLKGALAGIRAMDNCGGGNLTIPHKEAAIAHLDSLSPEAELIGAVNTIRREQDGGLRGHNTDGIGFLRALSCVGRLDPAGLRAVVLGAGGAARGV
ncbi:MAG: shikimate dehydrogenase family protein, partial [Candidatus Methylomirabilales bacterium]